MDTALFDFLPPKLHEMSELCGEDIMLKIWSAYGGCHLSVPKNAAPEHPITKTLTAAEVQIFCKTYGGEILFIPTAARLKREVRNALIRQQRGAGKSIFDLARGFNLTERQVLSICNNPAQSLVNNNNQASLFGD